MRSYGQLAPLEITSQRVPDRRTDGRTIKRTIAVHSFADKWELTTRLKIEKNKERKKTRPDTRQKMRLVCVLFTFENN